MLSFPGLTCTFYFVGGWGHKGTCFAPVPGLLARPAYLYRVRVLGSGSLDGYAGCWENGCRKPVPVSLAVGNLYLWLVLR